MYNNPMKKITVEYLYSLFAAGETDKFMELSKSIDVSGNPMYYSTRLHTLALLNMNRRTVGVFKHIREDKRIPGHLREDDYYIVLFAYAQLDQVDNPRVKEIYQNAVDNGVDFTDQLIKKIQGLKNKQ
jgi:hypothetical protein